MTSSTSDFGDLSLQKVESQYPATYPALKPADLASIHRSEFLQWFHDGQKPGVDLLIIDLRRMDHEVNLSQGSLWRVGLIS